MSLSLVLVFIPTEADAEPGIHVQALDWKGQETWMGEPVECPARACGSSARQEAPHKAVPGKPSGSRAEPRPRRGRGADGR